MNRIKFSLRPASLALPVQPATASHAALKSVLSFLLDQQVIIEE